MGNVLTITGEKPAKKHPTRKYSYYSEDPLAKYLLIGVNERGRTVYFFKMHITGLHERIFGPYDSRSVAVDCFDAVLQGALESFCDVQNAGRDKGNNGMEHIALPKKLTPVPVR